MPLISIDPPRPAIVTGASRMLPDGMPPIERATVFAIVWALPWLLAELDGVQHGEPSHRLGSLIVILTIFAAVLLSDRVIWVRTPVGASLFTLINSGYAVYYGQTDTFTVDAILYSFAEFAIEMALLPWCDPPGAMRRWSMRRVWPLPAYYLVSFFVLLSLTLFSLHSAALVWRFSQPNLNVFSALISVDMFMAVIFSGPPVFAIGVNFVVWMQLRNSKAAMGR